MNINENIKKIRETYEGYAAQQLRNKTPQNLYKPLRYSMDTLGKKIRPILCLLGHSLYNEEYRKALPAAYAVEIFHNFTLLHDDIMDKAEIRRGKPSVYVKYGVPSAILSGDVMLIYAYKYLNQVGVENSAQLIEILTETAIGVCEGQQLDMDYESREDVSIEDYLVMIRDKTSILLGCALQIGGLIGGASKEQGQHLYNFGKNIGIAFQIQDDLLDVFGEQTSVGKISGGDIINNKKTYLYLKALEMSGETDKQRLKELYHTHPIDPSNKIEEVKSIFKKTAVEEYAKLLMEAYLDLGNSHLDAAGGMKSQVEILKQLASFLIVRTS